VGYKWRKTKGFVDCRPKEYKSDIFPRPNTICSEKCIYYFLCNSKYSWNLNLNHMTLTERLKEIKLITQKPYHFFDRAKLGGVMLILEGVDGTQLSFHGNNMIGAIESATTYVEHEKKMGKLEEIEEEEEEEKEEEKEIEEEEEEGEEIEVKVKK